MPETTPDPVTELREAARLMRQRAERAQPWWSWDWHLSGPRAGTTRESGTERRREHIHSWHPGVALAVADWLDAETAEAERYLTPPRHPFDWDCGRCGSDLSNGCTCWEAALAVARAYLGRTDDQPA